MTLLEMGERLKAEFPGRCVCIQLECWVYEDGRTKDGMKLYDHALNHHFDCNSLEDGIAKLKEALQPPKAIEVDVVPAAESEVAQ